MNLNDYLITLKKQNNDDILNRISTNISDDDLKRYFGENVQENVIKYSELSKYNDISDLLNKDKSYKIILFENEINSGHWLLILRYNSTIEFFNSYGLKPNADFAFVSRIKNWFLGQNPNYLKNLLDNAEKNGFNVIYNKTKLQQMKKGINTCGRWIILRIIMMQFFNQDLQGFLNFIYNLVKQYNYSPDVIVTHLII